MTERLAHPELRRRLDAADLEQLRTKVHDSLHRSGVTFGPHPFEVDPVPRVIEGDEWRELHAGIVQRVRALEAFVVDAYGPRAIVKAGVVPGRVLSGADHYEDDLRGLRPPGGWIGVAGLDLLRAPDGRFAVVEDNLRTPSGAAYLLAARQAVDDALGWAPPERADVREALLAALRATLHAAVPPGV
ncbi:MAG TPA: circularly permuted type 2 ATP-grasp protein, partial [Solirubrobacteraceae bacterium]